MDADVEDREARLHDALGLLGVHVEASAERDPGPGWPADRAAIEQALELAHRRLEAEVLMHRETHARRIRRFDDRNCLRPVGSERLLHDHIDAASRGEL